MSYQNNTIEALKKLYVAMGGTAADVENLNITPEMIAAIADIYQGGGGSSLPAVTADDNGKVLAVVEGDWDKADAPKELPTVTTAHNGRVLKVANGAWRIGYDNDKVIIVHYGFVSEDPEDPTIGHWESNIEYNTVRSYAETGYLVVAKVESPYEEGTVYFVPIGGYNEFCVIFSAAAPANSSDMNAISTMIIQHGNDGNNDVISVEMSRGYLSDSQ